MYENVKPLYGQPIVTHTSRKYKFSALAVDEQVKALDGKTYDVLMIGTDNGKVLRVKYQSLADKTTNGVEPIIVEEIQVLTTNATITDLKIVKTVANSPPPHLIVVSNQELGTMQLQRCSAQSVRTCDECVALRDPYCAAHSEHPNRLLSLVRQSGRTRF